MQKGCAQSHEQGGQAERREPKENGEAEEARDENVVTTKDER